MRERENKKRFHVYDDALQQEKNIIDKTGQRWYISRYSADGSAFPTAFDELDHHHIQAASHAKWPRDRCRLLSRWPRWFVLSPPPTFVALLYYSFWKKKKYFTFFFYYSWSGNNQPTNQKGDGWYSSPGQCVTWSYHLSPYIYMYPPVCRLVLSLSALGLTLFCFICRIVSYFILLLRKKDIPSPHSMRNIYLGYYTTQHKKYKNTICSRSFSQKLSLSSI